MLLYRDLAHAHCRRGIDVPARRRSEQLGASLPLWFIGLFEQITDFGLSGWFLFPSGFVLLFLAAVTSPTLSRRTRAVLAMVTVRFGYLFLAIAFRACSSPWSKRLIGRARPMLGPRRSIRLYAVHLEAGIRQHAVRSLRDRGAVAIAIGAMWPLRTGYYMGLRAVDHVQPRRCD